MRLTFVALGWEQLSISLLSAIAKDQGYTTSLAFSRSLFNDRYNFCKPALAVFFDDTEKIISQIEKDKPDIVAFSPVTATYQWMLGVAKEVKGRLPLAKIVFGGVHVSAVPERVMTNKFIDYIVVGEGERGFKDILKHVRNGAKDGEPLRNTSYRLSNGEIYNGPRDSVIVNLDENPMFDKKIWEPYMSFDDIYFTITSRGCPYKCTYCFNNFFARLSGCSNSDYIRQRSPAHVMKELNSAKERYKLKIIEFEDDIFTLNKPWLKEMLEKYRKEIKRPFQCMTHPKFLDDETTHMLAESGCEFVQMGVQSMDDLYKNTFLKRPETEADVDCALSLLHKYKIKVKVDHMFALPEEPLDAQEKAKNIYLRYPPFRIQTFWTIYLPGTELLKSAVEKGQISREDNEAILEGKDSGYFRNNAKFLNNPKIRSYRAYELFFKLVPVVPYSILKNLNPRYIQVIPMFLLEILIFLFDVGGGIIKGNPDHIGYAKYYLRNIPKIIFDKISLGFLKKN